MLYCGTAIIFIESLRTFQPRLRKAYTFASIGIFLLAVFHIVVLAGTSFELGEYTWFGIVAVVAYVGPGIMRYAGILMHHTMLH